MQFISKFSRRAGTKNVGGEEKGIEGGMRGEAHRGKERGREMTN